MNGPRATGQEYTGKHRRDDGPGLTGAPPWGSRAESCGRPFADGRPVPGTGPIPGTRPESGFRPDAGQWADAG
jgi:hypothetical protein